MASLEEIEEIRLESSNWKAGTFLEQEHEAAVRDRGAVRFVRVRLDLLFSLDFIRHK